MQRHLALLFILITVGIDATGIGIIFPVMPELMEQVTGADISGAALWGGVLATAYAVAQFLCGPMVGNLSDRFGRRPVLLVALAVMALDYLVMALAPNVWVLLVGRVVAGATAATLATANAYLADISTAEDRAKVFGYLGAAFGIGFILGPLLGGFMAEFGVRAPFYLAAGIAAANLAFGWFVLPESLAAENRRAFSLARANPLAAFAAIGRLPGVRRYLVLTFIFTLAYQSYPSVWAFFGTARFGWDGWMNGLSLAVFGVCMVVVQGFLVAPAIRLWGERRAATYALSVDIAAFGFYGFVTSGFWALVTTPISALSGVAGPAIQSLMTNAAPADQQGELQGVLASVTAVATGLAPMVMTGVFYAFTKPDAPIYAPGAPFLLAMVLMIACVGLLVAAPRPVQPGATKGT